MKGRIIELVQRRWGDILKIVAVVFFLIISIILTKVKGDTPMEHFLLLTGLAELPLSVITWFAIGKINDRIDEASGEDNNKIPGYLPIALILSVKNSAQADNERTTNFIFFRKVWGFVKGNAEEDDSYRELLEQELPEGYQNKGNEISLDESTIYETKYLESSGDSSAPMPQESTGEKNVEVFPNISKPDKGIVAVEYTEKGTRRGRFVEIQLEISPSNAEESMRNTDTAECVNDEKSKPVNQIQIEKFVKELQGAIERLESYFDTRAVSEIHLFVDKSVPNYIPAILQNRYSNRYGVVLYDDFSEAGNDNCFLTIGKLEKGRIVAYYSRRSLFDAKPGTRIRFNTK